MASEKAPRIDQDPYGWFMWAFALTWSSVPGHLAFILGSTLLLYVGNDYYLVTVGTYAIYLVGMIVREIIAFRQRAQGHIHRN